MSHASVWGGFAFWGILMICRSKLIAKNLDIEGIVTFRLQSDET